MTPHGARGKDRTARGGPGGQYSLSSRVPFGLRRRRRYLCLALAFSARPRGRCSRHLTLIGGSARSAVTLATLVIRGASTDAPRAAAANRPRAARAMLAAWAAGEGGVHTRGGEAGGGGVGAQGRRGSDVTDVNLGVDVPGSCGSGGGCTEPSSAPAQRILAGATCSKQNDVAPAPRVSWLVPRAVTERRGAGPIA